MNNLTDLDNVIIATLFVSGEGVSFSDIEQKLNCTEKDIEASYKRISESFCDKSGIHIIRFNNTLQLASNPAYADQVSAVLNPIRERALTKAALETLAIIAYKQPITRLEMEEVRGVSCDYAVQVLMEQDMIEVVGRKDVIGKPLLYSTTDKFLKKFSLKSLDELPDQEQLLENLKLIRGEEQSDSLYYDFKLSDESEDLPEFLQGEEIEKVEAE